MSHKRSIKYGTKDCCSKLEKSFPMHTAETYLKVRLFQLKLKDEVTNLRKIEAGILQESVLGPFLYLTYICDLSTTENKTTAAFADDTALLAQHEDPAIASMKLQNVSMINERAKKRRINVNQNKSELLYTI
jgi:hypothetical protein